jgi:hypothetical protein
MLLWDPVCTRQQENTTHVLFIWKEKKHFYCHFALYQLSLSMSEMYKSTSCSPIYGKEFINKLPLKHLCSTLLSEVLIEMMMFVVSVLYQRVWVKILWAQTWFQKEYFISNSSSSPLFVWKYNYTIKNFYYKLVVTERLLRSNSSWWLHFVAFLHLQSHTVGKSTVCSCPTSILFVNVYGYNIPSFSFSQLLFPSQEPLAHFHITDRD